MSVFSKAKRGHFSILQLKDKSEETKKETLFNRGVEIETHEGVKDLRGLNWLKVVFARVKAYFGFREDAIYKGLLNRGAESVINELTTKDKFNEENQEKVKQLRELSELVKESKTFQSKVIWNGTIGKEDLEKIFIEIITSDHFIDLATFTDLKDARQILENKKTIISTLEERRLTKPSGMKMSGFKAKIAKAVNEGMGGDKVLRNIKSAIDEKVIKELKSTDRAMSKTRSREIRALFEEEANLKELVANDPGLMMVLANALMKSARPRVRDLAIYYHKGILHPEQSYGFHFDRKDVSMDLRLEVSEILLKSKDYRHYYQEEAAALMGELQELIKEDISESDKAKIEILLDEH